VATQDNGKQTQQATVAQMNSNINLRVYSSPTYSFSSSTVVIVFGYKKQEV